MKPDLPTIRTHATDHRILSPARLWRLLSAAALGGLALLGMLALAACQRPPLLYDVTLAPDRITPNADGDTDITKITYKLGRRATLSIYFLDAKGQRHDFRRNEPRAPGEYEVYFGGVINDRMLPDGTYTWVIEAVDPQGEQAQVQGTLVIADADTVFPDIRELTVYPPVFTPNRDGLSDRATISLYLAKDAELQVYLVNPKDPNRVRYAVAETEGLRKPGERGRHEYDYDAGVDQGAEPPPDGTYWVVAEAVDAVGQRDVETTTLTIREGGVPKAEILSPPDGDSVRWNTDHVLLGNTLCFTVTVDNYGPVPIRTSGPPPGTVYRDDQNYNTLGYGIEAGAWRVGIESEASLSSYPYRWAVGEPSQLVTRVINGQVYTYLPAGARGRVYGCIEITQEPVPNPLYFWAGLIHERVGIAPINNHVDPEFIKIEVP